MGNNPFPLPTLCPIFASTSTKRETPHAVKRAETKNFKLMINVTTQSASATSQVFTSDVTERLCQPFCVLSSIQPTVDVTYTIDATNLVGTQLYVTVKAQGSVLYVPKNGNTCCPKSKVFTEYFTTSFAGASGGSTVTVAQDAGFVKAAYVNCCNVACGISAANVVTLTFTA